MPEHESGRRPARSFWAAMWKPAVFGGVGGLAGYLVGRTAGGPLPSVSWDVAAQPLATVVVGAGAIGAGVLAYWNGQKTRVQDGQKHREIMVRDQAAELRSRYTTAASQLGNENSAVREAGIYAIAALVDDWFQYGFANEAESAAAHSQARVCLNLLCSYLRANQRSTHEWRDSDESRHGFDRDEAAVRESAIGVLRENLGGWFETDAQWRQERGVTFSSAFQVNLAGARLRNANFAAACLVGAILSEADLTEARLVSADLSDAQLWSANLDCAKLISSQLANANLVDAKLMNADLTGARLPGAWLDKADFGGTQLDSADFGLAHDIEKAKFNTETEYTKETQWPDGFTPQGRLIASPRVVVVLPDAREIEQSLSESQPDANDESAN